MQRDPWDSCTYCHGDAGRIDDANIPALAGQSYGYLLKQLSDFRTGKRIDPSGMMTSAVFLLDAGDDVVVAAYFAAQTAQPTRQSTEVDTHLGASLYLAGTETTPACVSCHDRPHTAVPRLSGLHPSYVSTQLRRFRAAERRNDESGQMRAVASGLSDKAIASVAAYVAGQRGASSTSVGDDFRSERFTEDHGLDLTARHQSE